MTPTVRKRAIAAVVAAVVMIAVLAAVLRDDDGGGSGATPTTAPAGTEPGGNGTTTTSRVELPEPARVVEGDLEGARVRLEVQPLVRAAGATVLTAVLTVVEPPEGDGGLIMHASFTARGRVSTRYDLSDVVLFVPDAGLLAGPATTADGNAATTRLGTEPGLRRGESAGLRAAFAPLPADVRRADVLWPILGVLPDIPVVDGTVPELPSFGTAPARDVELTGLRGEAQPVIARSSELEGAVKVEETRDELKVVLAADVLFALDRSDLSPQAGAAIQRAAAQIQAAGPGPVNVTGHTDDQGSEAYNLDLSNRRARAVADALGAQLPGDQYPLAVAGRGEAEPAVPGTSEDARAANRRVELLVERPQRAAPAAAPAAPAAGSGPTATAATGLPFEQSDGSLLRLRAERAVAQGPWLRVDLTATAERAGDNRAGFLVDLRERQARVLRATASGVGVLDGGLLRLPAVDPDWLCACPNTLFGLSMEEGEVRRMSLWAEAPPSLGPTVVVQLPREQGRLTDVPVQPR